MTVKVVTDTTADLPASIVAELGIKVVPQYVRFADKVYRDLVEISHDEFYRRLQSDSVHPSTSQPSPKDFVDVYKSILPAKDGILSLHLSKKLSGTYDSALQAKQMMAKEANIEVIDTQSVSMGLGLFAIMAARMAKQGATLAEIAAAVNDAIPQMRLLGIFDTLKYLAAGGRIGKAKALVGSILSVKPVLTVKEGELHPAGQVRSRSKGIDRLIEWTGTLGKIADLAVVHTTTPDEAKALAERLGNYFPKNQIIISRLSAAVGAHAGPGTLFVVARSA
ncbi:DegV family protein [Dehalogenimonas etheniformans]|uniref:DegV family protein n=1 Tax=Dehalogenimonas etheniformans TaxID=1536648 RepID=A0A2P5P5F4_9CHLR|nr:DegV family protein [Dehalogenimonas etheniformans]PPD57526.1 DegV family protein [Dehalogenimonas etheniformans]QNT76887.1 DegV family protein [Dehalogenimonas etheniformans]